MQVEEILIWEENERKCHARLRPLRYSKTAANSSSSQLKCRIWISLLVWWVILSYGRHCGRVMPLVYEKSYGPVHTTNLCRIY